MSDAAEKPYWIVVGFDGSEGSRRALVWAAEEARHRVAKVRIVRAWTPGEFGTYEEMNVLAHERLDEDVKSVLGQPPGGDVMTIAVQGHAAKILLQQAEEADMLVIGTRGHGGFAGLILGSVGLHAATHAEVPVLVIVRG
jgi:nucleotide-binding universal stress UspA family protein